MATAEQLFGGREHQEGGPVKHFWKNYSLGIVLAALFLLTGYSAFVLADCYNQV